MIWFKIRDVLYVYVCVCVCAAGFPLMKCVLMTHLTWLVCRRALSARGERFEAEAAELGAKLARTDSEAALLREQMEQRQREAQASESGIERKSTQPPTHSQNPHLAGWSLGTSCEKSRTQSHKITIICFNLIIFE